MLKMALRLCQKYNRWVDSIAAKRPTEPLKEPIPPRPLQILIDDLDPSLFENYNNQFNAVKLIACQVANIGLFEQRLEEINAKLRLSIQINATFAQEDVELRKVSSWFVDDKGFYLDNVSALEQIKILVIEFDKHYNLLALEQMGVGYYNWRHLLRFSLGLEATLTSLVALHNS